MPRPKTPPTRVWPQMARALVLAAALFVAFAVVSLGLTTHAQAQSTVRPPANATTNILPPGPDQQGGALVPPSPNVRPPANATSNILPPGPDQQGGVLGNTSVSTIWHDIRKGAAGNADVTRPGGGSGVLIQSQGEDWRLLRTGYVQPWGWKLLAATLAVLVVYFLIRGRIRLTDGRSGRVIPRFSLVERVVHWFAAILFVLLGLSGLVILLGRPLLIPLIGAHNFSVLASASMQGHNLFGPLFILSIIALFITFVRGNGYGLVDLKWLFKAGGLLGGHASSRRYNFGEKTWFWWATVCGIALSLTGILMLFPDYLPGFFESFAKNTPPGRTLLQFANLIHAIAALAFIAFGFGHIYLGTVGMEGALEGMTKGTVDENWAKEHHDLWYEEHLAAASTDATRAEVKAAAGDV